MQWPLLRVLGIQTPRASLYDHSNSCFRLHLSISLPLFPNGSLIQASRPQYSKNKNPNPKSNFCSLRKSISQIKKKEDN
uniref:Uncharacterized protein n=1 Tax=Rhizophora mucronata TaxID=61149 RepID=A0A2P2NFI4_RHIMU